jgi:hypothetical protein
MCLSDPLTDGQAQPRPAVGSGAGRVGAVEPLEDVRQMLGGNTRARVGDAQDRPLRLTLYCHAHDSA